MRRQIITWINKWRNGKDQRINQSPHFSRVHAQDSWLRNVDDRGAEKWPEHASVADSEGATCHILKCKSTVLSLLYYVMLCYVMLCYVMLYCIVLCHVVLYYVMLYYDILCNLNYSHIMLCDIMSCIQTPYKFVSFQPALRLLTFLP